MTQAESQAKTSNSEPEPEIEEPSRQSKSDRSKDNVDDYTYSLYDEGAYYYTYYGYAASTNDYTAFDSYNMENFNYYYDNVAQDNSYYYDSYYYYYYMSSDDASYINNELSEDEEEEANKGVFQKIKGWFGN